MKDVAGNYLMLGDKVVTMVRHYKDLVIGEVVGFTPKKIKVKTGAKQMSWGELQQGYTLKDPSAVCLVITRLEKENEVSDAYSEGCATGREAGWYDRDGRDD